MSDRALTAGDDAPTALARPKPRLALLRVIEMNVGFLGLQFSFGLQQGNMVPIYAWLGADPAHLPVLQLAGPVTGLLIQPLIGVLSDRTLSQFGRRMPYILIGAVMCSVCLLAMPFSATILMAASLLWLLDAGNNVTMEPYRAYVSDRLDTSQHAVGFLSQSAFTGLAQALAFLTPSILVFGLGVDANAVDAHRIPTVTHLTFLIGAVLSLATIVWSALRMPEMPLGTGERARIVATERSWRGTIAEIGGAIRDMPPAMRAMAWMSLFQWYGLSIYWTYITLALGRSLYGVSDTAGGAFRAAVLTSQQLGAFYNLVAFAAAFAMVPLARRIGATWLHGGCLVAAGMAMLALPHVGPAAGFAVPALGWLAMPGLALHPALTGVALGLGLGWASMMGNPYVILAGEIPPARTGIYMGIFNMMIVIPMLLCGLTFGWIYRHLLGSDPRTAIAFAGVLMLAAAGTMVRVPTRGPIAHGRRA